MYFDSQLRDRELLAMGAEAKRHKDMGFDCAWTFEAAHNPFYPLVLAAAATQRIQLGTNIAVAFARSPFATAQAAWDLQGASGGRFHLGLGTQVRAHVERRFSMPFEHPARRLVDYTRCMKAIWNSFQNDAEPDYQGEFYRFHLINAFFNPGPIEQPEIPVYFAGVNPRMCRAAGEAAEGFHVHPMHSPSYVEAIVRPSIAEGARAAGRRSEDVGLHASVFWIHGETEEERSASEASVREQVAFYASTPNYRALLEHHGFDSLGRELSQLMRQGDFQTMFRKLPDVLLNEVAVAAPPSQIGEVLRQRYEGLIERVSLYFPIPPADGMESWRDVVTAFHEAVPGAGEAEEETSPCAASSASI